MSCQSISNVDLVQLQKPAQYLGGEHNSIVKVDSDVDFRFALAFPDAYEVGMSHLGFQILYDVLNRDPKVWAERVYMPLPDMEAMLRKRKAPLFSLESKRALSEFDVIGFSLQYELCGTNILAMLELGGIPLYAADRSDSDPIILGGGPYSYHPEPLAPFFDAFFLGDAEEGIWDVVNTLRRLKTEKKSRAEVLAELSEVEGIYVPSRFIPVYDEAGALIEIQAVEGQRKSIERRLLKSLDGAPFPTKPVIPNIRTIHNRMSVEVMRGCVRGCRFCQAGYLYRPQRERSPEEVMRLISESLPETGYEELSLLSLSTADYCSIVPLLKSLMDRYGEGDNLAISFPSTRVDALKPEILEQVQRVRRTNFTVAPEAGTQRLRDVINKGVTDEEILETCNNVFTLGWSGIKLYFMLGLPTETDEDLYGIIDIARRIKALPSARNKDITVSVSSHVPKPHTPFQWAEQISSSEILRKQALLKDGLKRARVNFRGHHSFSSFLEGVFCRGDRRLATVIEQAYKLGARLDAWNEHLREDLWTQAFTDCGVDGQAVLRERSAEEVLPWEHLSCGISKDYFLKEYRRALRFKETPDCLTQSCSICGACDYDSKRNVLWRRTDTERRLGIKCAEEKVMPTPEIVSRVRLEFSKFGPMRYVGHLELVSVFHRTARRAGIPLAYSRGFHPQPKLIFGPALQLGIESEAEIVDAFLVEPVEAELIKDFFNQCFPPGLIINRAETLPVKSKGIQENLQALRYQLEWSNGRDLSDSLADLSTLQVIRADETGRKPSKEFTLRDFVCDFEYTQNGKRELKFSLLINPSVASPKPLEIASVISGLDAENVELRKISNVFAVEPGDSRSAPTETSSAA